MPHADWARPLQESVANVASVAKYGGRTFSLLGRLLLLIILPSIFIFVFLSMDVIALS